MILLCYGTRPEWIKIKPLVDFFNSKKYPHKILFTGQHEHISDGKYDDRLIIQSTNKNRLDDIISSVINSVDFSGISAVLIQGDTCTCLAIALTAFNHKVPIIHLEAGLRTYDLENPYPEEGYRQIISRITDIHLCPTELSKRNLQNEQITNKIYVVGNTVLDNLCNLTPEYGDEILVTLHRRENHKIIKEWFSEIDNLNLPITLIRHPNPAISDAICMLKNVKVIDPLPYDEMIQRIAKCKFLITDSGGLQEEGSFLNKRVIICRKTTERQEVLDTHGVLCPDPKFLKNIVDTINNNYIINKPCPFGDGKSSEKIFNILKDII